MSKTLRIFSLLMIVILLFGAAGCGSTSGRAALYGKWSFSSEGASYTMDFKSDGTVLIVYGETTNISSKYEFVDDDTITMYPPEAITGDPITFDFKINGDKMDMTANGVTQVLTRVK